MLGHRNSGDFIFQAFKRHHSKVLRSYRALGKDTSFSINYNFNRQEESYVELKTPNDKNTMLFVVLMRRFLNPIDYVCCKNVWRLIKENFAEDLPIENIKAIDEGFQILSKGFGEFSIYGHAISNENSYHIIANGDYFGKNDEEATKFLANLANSSAYLHLLYNFYSFNLNMFKLSNAILYIILNIENNVRYQELYPQHYFTDKRCMFCMSENGSFTTVEHIVPEALGNYDTFLPEGYVCNSCNNGILSTIDHALIDSDLLGLLQVYFVPYTKNGQFPKARYQNTVIQKVGPNKIEFRDTTNRSCLIMGEAKEGVYQEFTINLRGRKNVDERSIGRAAYKIGLEMVAFQMGKDHACDSKYDAARAFILNNQDFPNNLLISTKFTPNPKTSIHSEIGLEGTRCDLNIFGVRMIFNLEMYPPLELTQDLIEANFVSFPLYH